MSPTNTQDDKPKSSIEAKLQQLKNDFLMEISERCDGMEQQVFCIKTQQDKQTPMDELLRQVHSLKGSSSTHGIPMVPSICHQFENQLKHFDGALEQAHRQFTDASLRHIDLIRETTELIKQNIQDLSSIEATLNNMCNDPRTAKMSCLVLETAKTMSLMYEKILDGFSLKYTVIEDGLEGLKRLIHEHFDLLVIGGDIATLNGRAVIYALRASNSTNHDIKIILVTSDAHSEFVDGIQPDCIVKKDSNLAQSLQQAIQKYIH